MFEDERLEQKEVAALERDIMIGEAMSAALSQPDSALSKILDLARDDAIRAGGLLLRADLTTPEGVATAIALQARYVRFLQLIAWVYEAGDDADVAHEQLATIAELDEDEQLRKQINGQREPDFRD